MGTGSILIVVCELFLFYLRGVSFARVYCQSIVIVVMFDLPCALRLPVDASSRARVACERAGLIVTGGVPGYGRLSARFVKRARIIFNVWRIRYDTIQTTVVVLYRYCYYCSYFFLSAIFGEVEPEFKIRMIPFDSHFIKKVNSSPFSSN